MLIHDLLSVNLASINIILTRHLERVTLTAECLIVRKYDYDHYCWAYFSDTANGCSVESAENMLSIANGWMKIFYSSLQKKRIILFSYVWDGPKRLFGNWSIFSRKQFKTSFYRYKMIIKCYEHPLYIYSYLMKVFIIFAYVVLDFSCIAKKLHTEKCQFCP